VKGQRLLVDDEDRMRPGYWLHGYQFSGNLEMSENFAKVRE